MNPLDIKDLTEARRVLTMMQVENAENRSAHNSLVEQLAAMTQERDAAKTLAIFYSELAAASQAIEQQLREALESALPAIGYGYDACRCASALHTVQSAQFDVESALSLPQDDTALKAWGAELLREIADGVIGVREEMILRRKADELEEKK